MTPSFADLFLEAMRYEHWLRFYFLEDVEGPENGSPMQASPEREIAVESMDALLAVPADVAARSRGEEPELADRYGVTEFPAMLILNGEKIFRKVTGRQTLETVLEYLEM